MFYLYKKVHNITGLKYLGQTIRKDYDVYRGSGTRWTNHIKKHGYDVTTELLGLYTTKEELKDAGRYYSKLWDVVESEEWANLREEAGEEGNISVETKKKMSLAKKGIIPWNKGKKILPRSEEYKKKMSLAHIGKKRIPFTEEHKRKIGLANKGKTSWNKGISLSEEHKINIMLTKCSTRQLALKNTTI